MSTCAGFLLKALNCPTEFEQQFILLVLDKLVFGLLLLILGVLAKIYFDRYQKKKEFHKVLAIKQWECVGALYQTLLEWHSVNEKHWMLAQHLVNKFEQSNYGTEDEKKEIRNDIERSVKDELFPLANRQKELGAQLQREIDEFDIWVEDHVINKFIVMMTTWADLAKVLFEQSSIENIEGRIEKMEEIKPIQEKLRIGFKEIKKIAKSYR
jgi:hypothetical protein